MAETKRRGRGEDSIIFDHEGAECRDSKYHRHCPGRWRGVVSLGIGADGKRIRKKVSGRNKTDVRAKLAELHNDLDEGVVPEAGYTVAKAIRDWLEDGLPGRSAKTVGTYTEVLDPLTAIIGKIPLRELTAANVRSALTALGASRTTRTLAITHATLTRAIRHAEANDKVRRNVATLIDTPRGQDGRPSKSLTLAQAVALLSAAKAFPLYAYVVLSLLVGVRTEEARALRWDHVDLNGDPDADPPVPPHVAVWRSVRTHGDTKTQKSRRTLRLPQLAVEALREQIERQARARLLAGVLWQEHGLVCTSATGTPLDASHVRRSLRVICRKAGIGEEWTPRELRHTFVSLLSDNGMAIEEISRLVGHSSTNVTETVYRHELRPVLQYGAEVMDDLFSSVASASQQESRRRTVRQRGNSTGAAASTP
jgi:integrase